MRLRTARRNPAELLIVNPRPRSGSPRVVRRPFRRPSLARPAFASPLKGHKAARPKARPAPKRRVKAKKHVKARKPARKNPARKSTMAIKKRRKRSKRKASKASKRRHRKARANPIRRRRRRARKARRNPAKRRKRRSRRNPLVMRGSGKKAKFSFVGRTSSGKRKRRARPISKAAARRRVKRGEVVLVKRGRRSGPKAWHQASAKSVARALMPRTRKARKARRSAAAKRRKATSGIRAVEAARANPRRRRRARKARRNPSRRRRHARKARSSRKHRKSGRKHSRLHAAMSMRRNPSLSGVLADLKALAPQMLAATAAVGATLWLSRKVKEQLDTGALASVGKMIPAAVQPHVPAILTGLVTAGIYAAASMVPQLSKVKGGVAIGGAVATLLLLAQSTGLAAKVGLPGLSGAPFMGQPGGIFDRGGVGEYTSVGEYTNIGEYTTVGGLDDRSPMALMGMDDASVYSSDSLRGMDDAAPFAPGEGGILSGKMF